MWMGAVAEGENARTCPHCGNAFPAGASQCPRCDSRLSLILHSRETVLSLTAAIIIVLFFLTGFITRGYHQKLDALSRQWFATGEQRLKSGDAVAALADFRTALVYNPDDTRIQFRLAEALAAEGRDSEARAYLLGLLARAPSDAPINLALARISAGAGSETGALRYYHGAIYGVWPQKAEKSRLNARLELCRFLIARDDMRTADAELVALTSEIPEEQGAPLHEQAGELFLQVGDAHHALSEFRVALIVERPSDASLRGAGLAAYQLGDFRAAVGYLARAQRMRKDDPEVSSALAMSRLVVSADPNLRGVSEFERRERVRDDFEHAFSRLQSCAKSRGVNLSAKQNPPSDLTALYARANALRPQLTDRNLARHPSQMDAAMNLMFTMEDLATEQCGAPGGIDEALTLLGKFRPGRER